MELNRFYLLIKRGYNMEKLYRYYLFTFKKEYEKYSQDSTRLYAYCDDKIMKSEFENTRDMEMFDVEKVKLTKKQVNYLATEYQNLRLTEYTFSNDFIFPITMEEKLTIEYIGNRIINSDIYTRSFTINPYIFNDDYFQILKDLNYVDCYNYCENGDTPYQYKLYPDFLSIFIKSFGRTLDFGGFI